MPTVLPPMLEDHARSQAWVCKVDRLSWVFTLVVILGLLVATIGLGRLHLAYLLCSLLAFATRALPICADASAVVPGFLWRPEFQGEALREERAQAHEALRETYLEPLLVAAGQWKNDEVRAAMTLEEVEAVVAGLDMQARTRLFSRAFKVCSAMALLVGMVFLWLEVQYAQNALPIEGGLLRGLL